VAEAALPGLSPLGVIAVFLITAGQRRQYLRCVAPCQPSAAARRMPLSL